MEELLALYEDRVVNPEQQKTFVVAVRDCEDGMEAELEKVVRERLQAVWTAAVKPEVLAKNHAPNLFFIFVNVHFEEQY